MKWIVNPSLSPRYLELKNDLQSSISSTKVGHLRVECILIAIKGTLHLALATFLPSHELIIQRIVQRPGVKSFKIR